MTFAVTARPAALIGPVLFRLATYDFPTGWLLLLPPCISIPTIVIPLDTVTRAAQAETDKRGLSTILPGMRDTVFWDVSFPWLRTRHRTNMSARLRIYYAIPGICLLVYGLKTILAREIGTDGMESRGAAWFIQGDPAVGIGFLLGAVGAYLIYRAFDQRE